MKKLHRNRLMKLANLLDMVPKKSFDMRTYRTGSYGDHHVPCGTAGCAVGWAPSIMTERQLGSVLDHDGEISFPKVSERHLGINIDSFLWSFLFSAYWSKVDNTAKGAAARIRYFLNHGLPDLSNVNFQSERDLRNLTELYKPYIK